MKASQLRANVFRVLDQVLQTGEPVEIWRNGKRLWIVAEPVVPSPQPTTDQIG